MVSFYLFIYFLHLKDGHHSLQLFGRYPQHLSVFWGLKNSADLPSAWRWVDTNWIFIFGWSILLASQVTDKFSGVAGRSVSSAHKAGSLPVSMWVKCDVKVTSLIQSRPVARNKDCRVFISWESTRGKGVILCKWAAFSVPNQAWGDDNMNCVTC